MNYRKFGKTDLLVSEIGFGAWAIGGGAMIGETAIGWGNADDNESVKAIHAALDAGINFFDTADIYGLGHSETLLGKTIGKNKEIIIATKGGNVSRNNEFTVDYTKEYLMEACEASLKRLKRDVIDYYQLHTAKVQHLEDGECIAAMNLLQKQGKIKYWGLSLATFEPATEAEFLMERKSGYGFQLVLNLINQKALPLIKQASEKGYGIIARMPLQFGLLTGKFDDAKTNFAVNDHRKKRLSKEVIEKSLEALDPVWKLCEKYAVNKTQLALSYILSYAEVSTVIPGIRTPQHVRDNTSGLIKLDAQDIQVIEEYGRNELAELLNLIQAQG
jgi:aryl-alcohol dehydrogenase-like predicted oxidoreductase